VRYVPNVAKRSIREQCKMKYILTTDRRPATSDRRPTNDRPTSHLAHIGEISNGHISARDRPIHFMFGSTMRFSGSADRMALFPVSPKPRWRPPPSWKIQMAISQRRIVRFTPCLVLGRGFWGRRIEWRYFRFRQIQAAAILENSNGDISEADCPIYFMFGSRMGFSGSADRMALFPVSPNPRWPPS